MFRIRCGNIEKNMIEGINQHKDIDSEKVPERKPGFELPTFTADNLAKELSSLSNLISHDQPIKEGDIKDLTLAVKGMEVEEIEQIPDLKENTKIYQEIRAGNFEHVKDLSFLTDDIAELLSKRPTNSLEGAELDLNGLKTLSDEAARHLGSTDSELYSIKLSGLSTLSDEAAKNLGKTKRYSIELNSLTHLSDVASSYLCENFKEIKLPRLTSLSPKLAENLSRIEGRIELWGLASLSDEAARYLGTHKNSLYLSRVSAISDTVAQYLGNHEGELILDGLTEVSDVAAKELSRNKGELRLCGIRSLSDQAAKYLGKHEGRLCLRGLTTISDKAAKFLSKNTSLPGGTGYAISSAEVSNQIRKYRK